MSAPAETMELVRASDVQNAVEVFTKGGMGAILDGIEAKVRAIPLDPSTPAGRDQIRSTAHQIARTKTFLDGEGKALTEGWRKATALVNEERRKATERLDALREEIRRPLTEFEERDKRRIAAHEEALAELSALSNMVVPGGVLFNAPVALLEEHFADFGKLPERNWEEFEGRARKIRHETVLAMTERIETRREFEAQQAELARLRKAEEERLQRERDEAIARQAAEKARLEAERAAEAAAQAERDRVQAEADRVARENAERLAQAERERKALEEKAAADARAAEGRAEAARKLAEAEKARAAKEAADKIAAAEKARKDAEAKAAREKAEAEARAKKAAQDLKDAEAKAKRDAEAAVQRERERAEAARKAEEQAEAKRQQNAALRQRIREEIIADLGDLGSFDNGTAGEIADAILDGKVRNVKVVF